MMHFFQSQPFSITALPKINCNLLNETFLFSGLSELRIHIASLSDGGAYQCSTSQNYDYIKYEMKHQHEFLAAKMQLYKC